MSVLLLNFQQFSLVLDSRLFIQTTDEHSLKAVVKRQLQKFILAVLEYFIAVSKPQLD